MNSCKEHACDDMPDYVGVFCCGEDGWNLTVFDAAQRGFDERCYMGLRLDIPIMYCPFCGKELS